MNRVNVIIGEYMNIDMALLEDSDHGDVACYILPIIEEGQPVILPGQCDHDIAAVQNFSLGAVSI